MASIASSWPWGLPVVNPLWDSAEALLLLVKDCIDVRCADYARVLIETQQPTADCSTLAVVIGNARARSGSCLGRIQLTSSLDVVLIRCCDPVGELTTASGYVPPTPEAIEASASCLARDVWDIFNCIACTACEALGAISGVTACCDDNTGPPEIRWGTSQGGCRSATITVPLVFTACCNDEV